jgi:hypothetical protein
MSSKASISVPVSECLFVEDLIISSGQNLNQLKAIIIIIIIIIII